MTKDIILESIDSIDASCLDTEIAVIEAMVSSYEKYSIISENCDCDIEQFDFVIQEGAALDRVKKESKKDDNKLITVLKFIPRLIRALVDIIKKKFKDADIGDKLKEAGAKLNKAKDKEEKVKRINAEFDGKAECYIDEKTGKIKFKKDKNSIIATTGYLMVLTNATMNLYHRIEKEFDYENPSAIRSFIDDIDKLIHGNKDVTASDIFEGGFVALGDAFKHITSLTGELTLISSGVEKMADKLRMRNMASDKENPKIQEALKNTTELTGKMTKLNGIITGAIGSVSVLMDFAKNIFDLGSVAKETAKQAEEDTLEAVDTYITPEIRQNNPQKKGESDEAYQLRLRKAAIENVPDKEIKNKIKDIKKERKKEQKEQTKAEYKRKKEEARKGGSKDNKEDEE